MGQKLHHGLDPGMLLAMTAEPMSTRPMRELLLRLPLLPTTPDHRIDYEAADADLLLELADKAEASRFTELRAFLEQQQSQAHAALLNRLDNMETRLTARAQESDNTTAAYVGHLEQKLVGRSEPMA